MIYNNWTQCIRYEVAATAKLLGGFSFQYTLRGDGAKARQTVRPAPGGKQREAINMVPLLIFPSIALIASIILFVLLYLCVLFVLHTIFLPSHLSHSLLNNYFPCRNIPLLWTESPSNPSWPALRGPKTISARCSSFTISSYSPHSVRLSIRWSALTKISLTLSYLCYAFLCFSLSDHWIRLSLSWLTTTWKQYQDLALS